jgi:nucleoside-diphosphate-sugar epimerase
MVQVKDVFLVVGGSGFLGRHIVQQLIDRGDVVHVFDIVQRYHDVPFHSGDITDQASIEAAIQTVPLFLCLYSILLISIYRVGRPVLFTRLLLQHAAIMQLFTGK